MRHTSPAVENITGYKPAAFHHHPRRLLKLVHHDDRRRVADHLRACSHDAPACEFDFKIRRKNGSVAWISHLCQSVYDENGRWNGRRASNRDITNLRQAELTLARQERLQRGCQQGLRRLLGREGAAYVKDALELAGEAGGCSCAALMALDAGQSLTAIATWPHGLDAVCPVPWELLRERALPILSAGEAFELLPRETRESPGPMQGAHVAILPLLDGGHLRGIAAFAAPATRDPWSRAELSTLATLASGFSVALTRQNSP
jgi:PAS domain S-box-containing protein